MNTDLIPEDCGGYYRLQTGLSADFNQRLLEGFLLEKEETSTKKTHFFGGRFENIYVDEGRLEELDQVLTVAKQTAAKILRISSVEGGGWFNEMPPGHSTTAHRHDDDDELLSGVYYVTTPKASGNLLLGQGNDLTVISPQAGMMVFFSPTIVHEVETNQSDQMRLSIGMNFGQRDIA